jgi:hypothetical protein
VDRGQNYEPVHEFRSSPETLHHQITDHVLAHSGVTYHSTIASIRFTRFLDQSRFICMPFPKGFRNKPSIHREFVEAVEAKTAAGLHVIISMTYEEATYVSQKVTVDQETDNRARSNYKDQIRQSTILKTEWLFDVLVMDEIHVLRNRESDRCKAIQRRVRLDF